jgi:hypothetical protein
MRHLLEKHMHPQTSQPTKTRRRSAFEGAELDDLLKIASTPRAPAPKGADAPTASPAAAPTTAASNDETDAPKSRNDLFARYLAYQERVREEAHKQAACERILFGFSLTSTPRTEEVEDVASTAISMMVRAAQSQFSNQYITLSISTDEVLEATGQANWRLEYRQSKGHARPGKPAPVLPAVPVDLDKIGAYLDATYGGEAGQTALYKQIAKLLIRYLHLNDKDVKRTAKAVIAYQSITTSTARFGAKTGPYKFYHRENVTQVLDALSKVFEWAGLDELALALRPERHKMGEYEFTFDSREKFTFPGLELVTFKDSIDYKFEHAAATKLQLFVGEFGA